MGEAGLASDCCLPAAAPQATNVPNLAAAFRALADPTRFEVFRVIAAQPGPMCVCHIVDRFAVSQPTISHHLKVLLDAGLVTVSRRGVWAYYSVDPIGVGHLQAALAALAPSGVMEAHSAKSGGPP